MSPVVIWRGLLRWVGIRWGRWDFSSVCCDGAACDTFSAIGDQLLSIRRGGLVYVAVGWDTLMGRIFLLLGIRWHWSGCVSDVGISFDGLSWDMLGYFGGFLDGWVALNTLGILFLNVGSTWVTCGILGYVRIVGRGAQCVADVGIFLDGACRGGSGFVGNVGIPHPFYM